MALHLTPSLLELAYELLRATPPFKRWKLPHADEVEFRVITRARGKNTVADHSYEARRKGKGPWQLAHRIRIVWREHRTLDALFQSMAHEMCHIRQRRKALHSAVHGVVWQRLADQVCRVHRFDRRTF